MDTTATLRTATGELRVLHGTDAVRTIVEHAGRDEVTARLHRHRDGAAIELEVTGADTGTGPGAELVLRTSSGTSIHLPLDAEGTCLVAEVRQSAPWSVWLRQAPKAWLDAPATSWPNDTILLKDEHDDTVLARLAHVDHPRAARGTSDIHPVPGAGKSTLNRMLRTQPELSVGEWLDRHGLEATELKSDDEDRGDVIVHTDHAVDPDAARSFLAAWHEALVIAHGLHRGRRAPAEDLRRALRVQERRRQIMTGRVPSLLVAEQEGFDVLATAMLHRLATGLDPTWVRHRDARGELVWSTGTVASRERGTLALRHADGHQVLLADRGHLDPQVLAISTRPPRTTTPVAAPTEPEIAALPAILVREDWFSGQLLGALETCEEHHWFVRAYVEGPCGERRWVDGVPCEGPVWWLVETDDDTSLTITDGYGRPEERLLALRIR